MALFSALSLLANNGSKFGTIYADPPWPYGNRGTRAAATKHYDTTSLAWLRALPVEAVAAERAHLHLWTTNAFIFDAKTVLESWGFTYKSCFVWVKPQLGIGNYWRVSHEFLLLGVRGALVFGDKTLKSWAELPRRRHSEKPDKIREFVERSSPPPRMELFARNTAPGWLCLGDQVEGGLW